jgi:large subunit ribosomal protein L34e
MPEGSKRSRSLRRVFKKTPGGNTVVHYTKRKPSKAVCSDCGAVLSGVENNRPSKLQKLSKTQKRPSRPFGGVLCTKCTRKLMINKAREEK